MAFFPSANQPTNQPTLISICYVPETGLGTEDTELRSEPRLLALAVGSCSLQMSKLLLRSLASPHFRPFSTHSPGLSYVSCGFRSPRCAEDLRSFPPAQRHLLEFQDPYFQIPYVYVGNPWIPYQDLQFHLLNTKTITFSPKSMPPSVPPSWITVSTLLSPLISASLSHPSSGIKPLKGRNVVGPHCRVGPLLHQSCSVTRYGMF